MSGAKELKVLIVSSEVTPYAKSGGLGDVVGSLPKELKKYGVDVRVVFPKYKTIKVPEKDNLNYVDYFTVKLDWRHQTASIFQIDGEVPMYLIENDFYFGRDTFYGYGDDYERFAFFSKASVEFLNYVDFQPDIIHFNDWQTGLACVYLKDYYSKYLLLSKVKSVYTVHNLQYQGVFGKEILDTVDLNQGYAVDDKLEFYGNISYMKAGLVYSDAITTVSETYAEEIKTGAYGYGMDGVLRARAESLTGIVNGIDNNTNNPATDTRIFKTFTVDSLHIKKENKVLLQRQLNLPERDVPMIGIISRLVDQKGFDLIAVAVEEMMHKDIQMVVLGTGDGRYENMFRHLQSRFPEKVSANILFDEGIAQKIYAASDLFLMPSLFEPCGLGQLFAMRYGTIPIVRKTGGLADTVKHYDREAKEGTGFVFEDYDASGMMWAVNQALEIYNEPEEFQNIIKNAMRCDFSWGKSAEKYIELYLKLKDNA